MALRGPDGKFVSKFLSCTNEEPSDSTVVGSTKDYEVLPTVGPVLEATPEQMASPTSDFMTKLTAEQQALYDLDTQQAQTASTAEVPEKYGLPPHWDPAALVPASHSNKSSILIVLVGLIFAGVLLYIYNH